jgi:hypothetical protein
MLPPEFTNGRIPSGKMTVNGPILDRAGDCVKSTTTSANQTLTNLSGKFQIYVPGAGIDVTLPAVEEGLWFVISNKSGGANAIAVKNAGGSTIGTLAQNRASIFASDGVSWYNMGILTIA